MPTKKRAGKATSGARPKKAVKKAARKTAAKAAAKKTSVKKAPAKKAAAKAPTRGKAAPKKAAAGKVAPKKAAPRTGVRKPAAVKTAAPRGGARRTTRKTAAGKTAPRTRAAKTGAGRGPRSTLARTPRRPGKAEPGTPPGAIPGLSEEEQIRSAKYLPRDLPKRLFEEEQFLFPESYGVNRVRLLVRDPEWVFAYWDVSPETMKGLASTLGERALALSRLTLRVLDPVSGGMSDILLPPGARWWYIRTDAARRTYRAEIGITLPSGEFRQLAESNAVVTPRVGPSRERARRRLSYHGAGEMPVEEAAAAGRAERESDLAREPWVPGGEGSAGERDKGGASDSFRPAGHERPGASDTFRPGASGAHRR